MQAVKKVLNEGSVTPETVNWRHQLFLREFMLAVAMSP